METLHSMTFMSPVGPLFLAASEVGLVALEFEANLPGQRTVRPNPRDWRAESNADGENRGVNRAVNRGKGHIVRFEESETMLSPFVRELEEYFAGTRREFSFALDLRGTDFQIACWRALLAIPYGETRSYADIARAVGQPKGFRA